MLALSVELVRTLVLQVLSLRESNQSQQQNRKGRPVRTPFFVPAFRFRLFFMSPFLRLSMFDSCLLGFVRKRRFVFFRDGVEPENLGGEDEECDSAES